MQQIYAVVKGVNPPPNATLFTRKYPFPDMGVNDHFVVTAKNKNKAIKAAYTYADREGSGKKFKAFPLGKGKVGIWRVA